MLDMLNQLAGALPIEQKEPEIIQTGQGKIPSNLQKGFVPKIAFNQREEKREVNKSALGFAIDLTRLKDEIGPKEAEGAAFDYQTNQDFQDEFMAKYDEFSESWR